MHELIKAGNHNAVTTTGDTIPAMSRENVGKVQELEDNLRELPQVQIETIHTIHDGVYTRTIMVPAGAVITGVEIKVPTTLIVYGDTTVYVGDKLVDIKGYCVLVCEGGRKQALMTRADTWFTMLFKTDATTIEEAERAFTDYYDQLASHLPTSKNKIIITEV